MALKYAFQAPEWANPEAIIQRLRDWSNFLNLAVLEHVDLSDRVKTSTTTVANTTDETAVYSCTISRGQLTVGKVVRTRVLGRYGTVNGSDTVTLRFKVGGTEVHSIASTAASITGQPLQFEFCFTVRSVGATGTLFSFATGQINNVGKDTPDAATTTVDTTGGVAISVTAQWSAANAANTLSIDQAWTEYLGV